jgi:hypothetical protein
VTKSAHSTGLSRAFQRTGEGLDRPRAGPADHGRSGRARVLRRKPDDPPEREYGEISREEHAPPAADRLRPRPGVSGFVEIRSPCGAKRHEGKRFVQGDLRRCGGLVRYTARPAFDPLRPEAVVMFGERIGHCAVAFTRLYRLDGLHRFCGFQGFIRMIGREGLPEPSGPKRGSLPSSPRLVLARCPWIAESDFHPECPAQSFPNAAWWRMFPRECASSQSMRC